MKAFREDKEAPGRIIDGSPQQLWAQHSPTATEQPRDPDEVGTWACFCLWVGQAGLPLCFPTYKGEEEIQISPFLSYILIHEAQCVYSVFRVQGLGIERKEGKGKKGKSRNTWNGPHHAIHTAGGP